ncbi:hypothetical protein AAFF_G00126120 [Aldrovandia affinis]|uniref:UPAR/Ly6 domain-containing protein n=1 Tax=Aldrovandia affinis TaxID=143900 RepID=A0AAD7W9G3_9TELE|nr:hypothetical protein AAFF_G00126120 [Aldrovandia affinis]
MMKLLIKLSLACALFSRAYPLDCFTCASIGAVSCLPSTNQTCATNQTCISGTAVNFLGSTSTQSSFKACATPDRCNSGSFSFGSARVTVNTECCDTDLCNNQSIPVLAENLPNGRQCFTCEPGNCTGTHEPLACRGPEDRCFTFPFTIGNVTSTLKGCASQSLCSVAMILNTPALGLDIVCCEGNLCNNALHVRQSVLLLLGSLASIVLFN